MHEHIQTGAQALALLRGAIIQLTYCGYWPRYIAQRELVSSLPVPSIGWLIALLVRYDAPRGDWLGKLYICHESLACVEEEPARAPDLVTWLEALAQHPAPSVALSCLQGTCHLAPMPPPLRYTTPRLAMPHADESGA